ncbi:hypothetical protein ABIB40_003304 [Pedobacter sp. UYP30]|uniref:hypothetical protein n=1 Tax=Pedobacter sp. UYP30 TaxID=1756400 RepID=UPI0033986898
MKKFIKITVAIILSLLLFLVLGLQYRQYLANRIYIPKRATAVIKISVDEIYKTIGLNIITSVGYYSKKDTAKTAKKTDIGLTLPANIYFFNTGARQDVYFSKFKVTNFKLLENFLYKILGLTKDSTQNLARSKSNKIVVFYTKTSAVISFSINRNISNQALADIIAEKDFAPLSDSNFKQLVKASDDIVYQDNESFATLNFNNGNVAFKATTVLPALVPNTAYHNAINYDSSTITAWLDADVKQIKNRTFKLGQLSMQTDSLLKYYGGGFNLNWLGTTTQIDSVITYGYNDDFEKIEELTLQKKKIPNLTANIKANAKGLKNYLANQGFLNLDSNKVNRQAFPLYKIFLANDSDNLYLATSSSAKAKQMGVNTSGFCMLYVNFQKLVAQSAIPSLNQRLSLYQTLMITGRQQKNRQVLFSGQLKLKDKKHNSLVKILKNF